MKSLLYLAEKPFSYMKRILDFYYCGTTDQFGHNSRTTCRTKACFGKDFIQ